MTKQSAKKFRDRLKDPSADLVKQINALKIYDKEIRLGEYTLCQLHEYLEMARALKGYPCCSKYGGKAQIVKGQIRTAITYPHYLSWYKKLWNYIRGR